MTTSRIIYTRPDGGVSVVVPAPNFIADFAGTEAEAMAAVQAKSVPADAIEAEIVDVTVISSDRAFRDAWVKKGGRIEVDIPKARAIKTDQIRPERNERLATLDIDYMRADESGDTSEKQRIANVKQTLRDLPATIQPDLDAISQPEELEAYEPTWPTAPE
jgi:hypothetical protein